MFCREVIPNGGTGYESGYGYCLAPYGTAYRRALRTTRTRIRTRIRVALQEADFLVGGVIDAVLDRGHSERRVQTQEVPLHVRPVAFVFPNGFPAEEGRHHSQPPVFSDHEEMVATRSEVLGRVELRPVRPVPEGWGVDVRLPGKGNSNSHGARPVY